MSMNEVARQIRKYESLLTKARSQLLVIKNQLRSTQAVSDRIMSREEVFNRTDGRLAFKKYYDDVQSLLDDLDLVDDGVPAPAVKRRSTPTTKKSEPIRLSDHKVKK